MPAVKYLGPDASTTDEIVTYDQLSGGSMPEVFRNFFNGTIRESFDATATSDGATITLSVEQSGGGDLTLQFSDGDTTLDCTPADTIALTAGTDAAPQDNFIYVLQSTKALTKSTTSWPSAEHAKIGYFLAPSATYVQSDGLYVNQNWNDHLEGADDQGHLAHMTERMRIDGAYYFDGLGGAGTSNYLTIAGTTVDLKINAGNVFQMHKHSVPAFDTSAGDTVHVKNWSGDAYHDITNLYDIVNDSTGSSIGTNSYFNIVVWGAANKTGEYEPMFINLPSGTYSTLANAENDVNGYDDYSIPREFSIDSSTGYLICRITVQKQGSTWAYSSASDLRGMSPSTASVSGGSGISNVVEDTSPQLGGGLDVNGQEITGAIDLHSTGDIIQELGDAAGTNKVSIKDSGAVEVASINSDGDATVADLSVTGTLGGTITDPTTDSQVGDRGWSDGRYAAKEANINTQSGTSYTLALSDSGGLVERSNGSAQTLTVPTNASVAFPIGSVVMVSQTGAGALTINHAGVTVNVGATWTKVLNEQWSVCTLIKTATDTWILSGDLEPA